MMPVAAAALRAPLVLLGLLEPAGAVVAAAAHSAAADAHRLPADAAAVRHQAAGGDAAPHAVVAHGPAPDAGDAGDPRRRRPAVESGGRATRTTSPLALLIDDGFPAAGTWDARMRTADDLINRAETDGRGVALIPLSETGREIGFETPGAARVRLKQIKPKPYAVQRSDALPGLTRFFGATADVETVWLSDGVDLGGGSEFVAALGRAGRNAPDQRDRGRPCAGARAGRRREHRRRADRQGSALRQGQRAVRHDPRPRSQGPAARRSDVHVRRRTRPRPTRR